MTRSLTGALIKDDQFKYKTRLNLQNDLISYTSDYALPGASEQADIKQEKVAQIATIIGDYKIQSKPEKKRVSVEKTSEKIEVIEDSEATDEALELLEEGEKNKQTKQDIPEPGSYEPSPVK